MKEQPLRKDRHFLTDAAIYGIGSALVQAVSIVLLPLYTRYLSPADFGVMEIIERVGNIVNICLMTGGVGQAAMAFYLQAKDQRERERVAMSVALLLLMCFLSAALVTIAVASPLSGWLGISDPKLLVFGVVAVLTQLLLILPLTLMQARVESIAYVSISLAISLCRIVLAILFVAYLGCGLMGVYWSMLITFLGFGLILLARELRRGAMGVDWQKCLAITRFSLPFVPTGILFFLLYNGDRFFLLGTAGTAAVGIYALGAKLAGAVAIVSTTPLFKVWSAQMYTALEQPGGSCYGGRMLSQMLLAYGFVGICLCMFQKELLAVISRDNYAGAGSVIAPLVLANGFMFASTFMECAFYVRHRTIFKPLTAVVGTAVTVVLYALLIPRYSILGAAYATLLGYASMAVVTYFVAQRVLHIKYELGVIFKLVAISVLCYLPAAPLELGLWQFAAKIGLLVAWIASVWLGGILNVESILAYVKTQFSQIVPALDVRHRPDNV